MASKQCFYCFVENYVIHLQNQGVKIWSKLDLCKKKYGKYGTCHVGVSKHFHVVSAVQSFVCNDSPYQCGDVLFLH